MRCVLTLLLLTVASHVALADATAPDPIVIVFPSNVGFKAINLGILDSGLASAFVNGRGASQMKDFRAAAPGVEWSKVDLHDFNCIGASAADVCPEVLRFEDGDSAGLLNLLHSKNIQRAQIIFIMQLFDGWRYRSRATLENTEVGEKSLVTTRTMSAIFEADVPMSIVTQFKKSDEKRALDYWTQGSPSRLEKAGLDSIPEMARMLTALTTAMPSVKQKSPDGWDALKGVKEFEEAGRLKCHGLCGGTRVFQDGESRVWLTTNRSAGMFGWTLVSIDHESALVNSNFLAFTLAPTL